ncbi:MAG: hypothetical protein AAFV88_18300 [Planctomycetota bacterium]
MRFLDTTSEFDRAPFAFHKRDQPPRLRMVGRYLADATELRYRDRYGSRRVAKWYRRLMATTAESLKAKGVERLEF